MALHHDGAALDVDRRYRGPGRREALIALGGSALIIAATLGYFVPASARCSARAAR